MSSMSSSELVKREKRLMCPYNSAHLIDPLRMAIHLVKCRKQNPHMQLKICPFNATHHVHPEKMKAHLERCSDKSVVEKSLFYRRNPSFQEVSTSITPNANPKPPPASIIQQEEEEDWDAEILSTTTSYDPEKSVIFKEVSRLPPPGLGKATRKKWREVEELRIHRLREGEPIHDLVYPTVHGGEKSIADIIGDSSVAPFKSPDTNYERVSLPPKRNSVMSGDRAPRQPHLQTRIAANIFGGRPVPPSPTSAQLKSFEDDLNRRFEDHQSASRRAPLPHRGDLSLETLSLDDCLSPRSKDQRSPLSSSRH